MIVAVRVTLHTDAGPLEKSYVILEWHEERAVIFYGVVELCPKLVCPLVGLVRPVALPFVIAPRIAHLTNSDSYPLVLKFVNIDQRVGVSGNNALTSVNLLLSF